MKEVNAVRRLVAIALALALAAVALAGCRPLVEDAPQPVSVYATFYPLYALTDALMKGVPDAELHCLVQPQDGCLRAYQLSNWDAALLSAGANAVVMGGRGLESFEDTLFGWGDDGPAICAALYNLELYSSGSGSADAEAESHLAGPNPHLYMSLDGAGEMVESISAMLVSLDPDYAETYAANAAAAREALDGALEQGRSLLSGHEGRRVALLNEALVYVARDYGLTVAEQIERESGEALTDKLLEACLEKLSDAEVDAVLIERQAPQVFVEVLEDAGFTVARLDVLSTHREGEGFDDYIQIQLGNARALREALDRAEAGKDDR